VVLPASATVLAVLLGPALPRESGWVVVAVVVEEVPERVVQELRVSMQACVA
jgi:hypothetical protein